MGLKEFLAVVFTVLFLMGLGASAYHQDMVLTKGGSGYGCVDAGRDEDAGTDEGTDASVGMEPSVEADAEACTDEAGCVVYEMTNDEIEEEEYLDSLELLAACVEAEAGNQGMLGKRLVADVILNRVDSPDFPDTIEGVITQPYHFTSYWDGSISEVSISDETFEAVTMELRQRSYPSLLFFTAGTYSGYGTPCMQVGDHYFSTK